MAKKISIKTRQARIERRRRYHYYEKTPFANLIKPEKHHVFRRWYYNELITFLENTAGMEYLNICYFNFNLKPYDKERSYSAFISSFAKFLVTIGKKDGLTDSLSMIFRYITDPKHSNLPMSEIELKRLIYSAFKPNN